MPAEYRERKQQHGGAPGCCASAAQLLASGQRVQGVLWSFAATGIMLRGLGREATAMPELLDAPQYVVEMSFASPTWHRSSAEAPNRYQEATCPTSRSTSKFLVP
ncbi:hypothetical protein ACX9NE_06085 [Mycobacterium sp. ML4]